MAEHYAAMADELIENLGSEATGCVSERNLYTCELAASPR